MTELNGTELDSALAGDGIPYRESKVEYGIRVRQMAGFYWLQEAVVGDDYALTEDFDRSLKSTSLEFIEVKLADLLTLLPGADAFIVMASTKVAFKKINPRESEVAGE